MPTICYYFFEDEQSLCNGVRLLDEIFYQYRLAINVTKTKSMILNNQYRQMDYPTSISKLRGKKTGKRHYVQIPWMWSQVWWTHNWMRYAAADSKFYSLSRNIMNNKIKLKTRTMMLNSLVRSRMVYESQTWCLSSVQSKKLNSNFNAYLRKMAKGGHCRKEGSWSYVYTNENLLQMSGTTDVITFVQKQQKKYVAQTWFWHWKWEEGSR